MEGVVAGGVVVGADMAGAGRVSPILGRDDGAVTPTESDGPSDEDDVTGRPADSPAARSFGEVSPGSALLAA
ncbi:MAG TPA: hypothetical protein VMB82_06810 [Acidimicrobiales bacterium]|nr:hypothetical protein [Acidimicrobiales bacterium]